MTALELVRGLAALEVFAGHLLSAPEIDARLHWLAPLAHFGTEAVIVFFVLSGLVIRLSLDDAPRSAWQFGRARLLRILPAYLVSLSAAAAAQTAFGEHPDATTYVGHLAFLQTLQGFIVPTVTANPPLWSLSCEMSFYVAAMLCVGLAPLHRATRPGAAWWVWSVLAVAAMATATTLDGGGAVTHLHYMLGMSATWLVGFFGIELSRSLAFSPRQAWFLAALLPLLSRLPIEYYSPLRFFLLGAVLPPLFADVAGLGSDRSERPWLRWGALLGIYASAAIALHASDRPWTSVALYLALPPLVAAAATPIRSWMDQLCSRHASPVLALGTASYALYVIHFPILWCAQRSGLTWWLQVATTVVATALSTWLIEWRLQPWVRRMANG